MTDIIQLTCYDCGGIVNITLFKSKRSAWKAGNAWLNEQFMQLYSARATIGKFSSMELVMTGFSVQEVTVND